MRWLSFMLVAAAGYGQSFEVATVKPTTRNANGGFAVPQVAGGPGTSDPSRITYLNYTLKNLLLIAYDLKPYQFSGPAWMDEDSERFVIAATVRPGTSKEQTTAMLQQLLAERFHLTLHKEAKELTVYDLTVVKRGPKLRESLKEGEGEPLPAAKGFAAFYGVVEEKDGFLRLPAARVPPGGDHPFLGPLAEWSTKPVQHAVGGNQPIAGLVAYLSLRTGRPVLDKTGLSGNWDYNLEFVPAGAAVDPSEGAGDPAPDLMGAVREQLGLKLEPKKGPTEVMNCRSH